ncbi:MAG: DUF4136 domain-containing protein [Pseudoxanthomonas sp.]|nr:DUF4136 domain-containing protein [Pseudoxanthomonas sp.]
MQFSTRFAGAGFALFSLLLLAACASGPKISSEADPQADFGSYRTFGFYSPLAVERAGYATPTTDRIKAATRAQLEARAYVYSSDQPDLLVNLNGYLQERTDVSTIPSVDYGYYYNYRTRGYVTVPVWTERTQVSQYTEGTLNIDLIDRRQNKLVWEGIAVGRVAKLKPDQRAARIDSTVAEIFARYPYRAGVSAPAQ